MRGKKRDKASSVLNLRAHTEVIVARCDCSALTESKACITFTAAQRWRWFFSRHLIYELRLKGRAHQAAASLLRAPSTFPAIRIIRIKKGEKNKKSYQPTPEASMSRARQPLRLWARLLRAALSSIPPSQHLHLYLSLLFSPVGLPAP